MNRKVTILAIDGAGGETADYLRLLRATLRDTGACSARLLTSDARARDAIVDCVVIPRLDYLAYSRFAVESLAPFVETEFALLVQLDGFVLNPGRWDERFFDFDYVGAPWTSKRRRPIDPARSVGNGGFSLRSRRFLEASGRLRWYREWEQFEVPTKYWGNEDYFLCVVERASLEADGIRFAPRDVARRFSIQAGDRLDATHTLDSVYGFHGKALLGKAKRHVEGRGRTYPHLERTAASVFPLFY